MKRKIRLIENMPPLWKQREKPLLRSLEEMYLFDCKTGEFFTAAERKLIKTRVIQIEGFLLYVSDLAWLMYYKVLPGVKLLHADGNEMNNRYSNLKPSDIPSDY